MALHLPDWTSVGIENAPPGDTRPTYSGAAPEAAAQGVLGTGLQTLGHGVQLFAEEQRKQANLVNASLGKADLHENLAKLQSAVQAETDPEKINQLYAQMGDQLEKSAQVIQDPAYRNMWMAFHRGDVTNAQIHAVNQQRRVYADQFRAGAESQVSNALLRAQQAPDQATRDQASKDIADIMSSMANAGVITHTQAQEAGQKANEQVILGTAHALNVAGNPQGAVDYLMGKSTEIPAQTLDPLLTHFRSLAEQGRIKDLVAAISGRTDKGYGPGLPPGSAEPNDYLAEQRQKFKAELDANPALKRQLAAVVDLENPQAGVAVAESLMNRMAMTGGTIASGIGMGNPESFYNPVRKGQVEPRMAELAANPDRLQARMRDIDAALAGSNLTRGHTDQGSASDPNYVRGGVGVNIAGERFNDFSGHAGGIPGSQQFRMAQQAAAGVPPVTQQTAAAGAPVVLPGGQPSPPQGFEPYPNLDAQMQQAQALADSGQISQESANKVMAGLHAVFNHQQSQQAADRLALNRAHANTEAALIDGKNIDYNPAAYYHFFPPEQAAEKVQQLDDAKEAGQLVSVMRTSDPAQIAQQRAQLVSGLNDQGAPDYVKRRKLLYVFDQQLQERNKILNGPQADPAAYLRAYSPVVQQAAAAADAPQPEPQASQNYANAMLSEQTRMGVPQQTQRILTNQRAQEIAYSIGSDPEHAPDIFKALSSQYGQFWPHVWSDLITAGKLPAAYQVVGQLADYDPGNAAVLASTLGARQKDDPAFERLISTKMPGGKSIKDVADQTIPNDPRVKNYERSLLDSGASPGQVTAVRAGIEHLAAGRVIRFHEEPSDAAEKAMAAVVGHYEFMPNGGARVPTDRFADVSANARDLVRGLSLDNISVPQVFAGRALLTPEDWTAPGAFMPQPQEYVDQIKANPTFITGPKADRLLLLDPAGRIVNDKSGSPIVVPFALPGPVRPAVPFLPTPESGAGLQ